jgi:hypothetical protein
MCLYLKTENIIGNAFIELIERNKQPQISIRELHNYGTLIAKKINESGEMVIFESLSRNLDRVINHYPDYFESFEYKGDQIIILKNGISENDLWREFRGDLTLDLLRVYLDSSIIFNT